ncbi:helix-turn-helix domain-containing protein [Streptacidiphilus fuscans]|uniref:helix-turn-helix domain-containing protein n=1 Tax=Streptacidiphilus fuscans TaxID=2789292 RepID=UPI002E29D7AB|nr:helix-turn-helix domain-containing protein [Streptacidiphilus fuscans]
MPHDGSQSAASGPDLLHGVWYTTDELADVLGVDASTLRRWRRVQPPQGPPFIEVAPRLYRYNATDVEAYLWAKRTDPAKSVA